jgi:hypothetical protein
MAHWKGFPWSLSITPPADDITALLFAAHAGDRAAADRERPGHTLQPTALVHEADPRFVDHARNRRAGKRGGGGVRVTLDADLARVVDLRAFGGLTVEETAEVLQVSPATVKRHWAFASAWRRNRMAGSEPPGPGPTSGPPGGL